MTSPGIAPTVEAALRRAVAGEVAFDAYSRAVYAGDASLYAMEPLGVVHPRDRDDVAAAVAVAAAHGVPVLPRGAATSLAGQTTVARGIVLDFSRHMAAIIDVDPDARIARVQPGVVQDDLNRAVAPHGLFFAPDTSTSNRATLGGMIGNNSCGARSARYGMTIDHVDALEVVLSDGSRARFHEVTEGEVARRAAVDSLEGALYRTVPALVRDRADVIRTAFPAHWRRSGGYRLDRLLPEAGPLNLARLLVGSEGTLAVTTEATVRLVPLPGAVAALVGHFETIEQAIAATPTAMDAGAMAVELVDRIILDYARHSPLHSHLPGLLEGEPGAILWVEFYGEDQGAAVAAMEGLRARWRAEGHGYAVLAAPTPREQEGFRQLRKAGQGLLLKAGKGGERSIAFVEDTAVPVERLAEYTRRLSGILDAHGLRAGFYGHASAGCLHVRPYMDLSRPGQPERMRAVAEEVLELVVEFGGMNSSEHGDGLVRGEFNRRFFGDAFYELMREVKGTFDPRGILNPGKKVDVPPMTERLRAVGRPRPVPLKTWFAFEWEGGGRPGGGVGEGTPAPVNGGAAPGATAMHPVAPAGTTAMHAAADACARIGACRKSAAAGGVMCPSYMATREEEHATRGRANALVAALESPDPRAALADDRLHEILDLCLECKACRHECPLHVDMAMLKSEALAQRYESTGVPLRARFFGNARTIHRVGAALAPLSNLPSGFAPARWVLEKLLGIDARRPLPRFQRDSLPRWFTRRGGSGTGPASGDALPPGGSRSPRSSEPLGGSPSPSGRHSSRGPLIFLADSFTSYTEPEIGRAAVEMLEWAGWEVEVVSDVCCGRSFISKGMLREAREAHRGLLQRLGGAAAAGAPIVGCEPSCVLTLGEELPDLAAGSGTPAEVEAARVVAGRARLVDDLLADAVEEGALVLDPASPVAGRPILFHGHCHQKAARATAGSLRLLRAIPGSTVEVLDAGCCGMAGSFGFEREHYELSMAIGGQRLFPAVREAPADALVAATGVSCRQQVAHGTGRTARHPLVLLHEAVKRP